VADYRQTVAEARRRRDEQVAAAQAEAREALLAAARERDAAIRRLCAEGYSRFAIAPLVGCSHSMVYELLNPVRRTAYNERRRKHARHLTLAA